MIRIAAAADAEALREAVCTSLEMLEFDYAELHLIEQKEEQQVAGATGHSRCLFSWTARQDRMPPLSQESLLKIELPLHNVSADKPGVCNYGTLLLMKDMRSTVTEPYLLKRVEQLRRSIIVALEKWRKDR